MGKKISLKIKDKTYILEFSRKSVLKADRKYNLTGNFLSGSVEITIARVFDLFSASFEKNHPDIQEEEIIEIFSKTKNVTGLFTELSQMFADTLETLFPQEEDKSDEGNTNWEVEQ